MKKLLSLFIACLTLVSCGSDEQALNSDPSTTELSEGEVSSDIASSFEASSDETSSDEASSGTQSESRNFIKLDGATANIPMGAAFYKNYYSISREEAEGLVQFSKSSASYYNLIDERADLLIVSRPDAETQDYIKQSGVELEYLVIRREALCFIINKSNKVTGVTSQQIKDVYQGKITNWSKLGGADQKIAAFQRNEDSGSQAMMKREVMKELTMMKAPTEYTISEMEGLVETLARYNNAGNAIGYSTYYYTSVMYKKPELKYLAIDGVTPSNDSISNSKYPFLSDGCVVFRKNEPADGPVRKAAEWFLSKAGKEMIKEEGYVPSK